ncbi:host attachment protein [Maliponia aquimaris]|uniref:Protein required for attachment to host cells n=1 Tax=Maliponia aquimaris TaxID=1673631 RepID=A0A238KM28_9RHOB|nr:host attachment protein [Maliponia aquimaris]SMX43707.1 Protein required for attachment to host cells [Maliponia aquimaris]
MRPVRTLVLVANDREARVLENEGVGKGLHQLGQVNRDAALDLGGGQADQRGRSQAGPGMARHGMEPATDEEAVNRARFAAALAEMVAGDLALGGHDRLIVCAPPKMLGALREALSAETRAKLSADLPKDLVHTPLADLPKHFDGIAAF